MDQYDRNTLGRFDKLKTFFADNPGPVAEVEALGEAVAAYLARLGQLPAGTLAGATGVALPAGPGGPTSGGLSGATEDKSTLRTALSQRLVPLMAALKSYFKAQEDRERSRAMDLRRPGDLPNMGLTKYTTLVALARQYAQELPADTLKKYNQPADEIKKFGLAAEAFGIKESAPDAFRDKRKTAGEHFEEQLDAIRDFIDDDLKTAVNLVSLSHPEFVRGFKQANKTDDRPGKQKKKDGTVPPPAASA